METKVLNNTSDFDTLVREKKVAFGQIGAPDLRVIFDFPFHLQSDSLRVGGVPAEFNFYNCVFKKRITLASSKRNIRFEDCAFEDEFNCNNSDFEGKIRLRKCTFAEKANFKNAKFKDLADFWRTTFKKETIFYKTDFMGTVVFSATTFEKNVLFTYALIEKLILFRGTKIREGIDLSTAIITGSVGTFGLSLWDFKAKKGRLTDQEFETAVSETGEIPIKNKRETFRILKQANIQQNNVIESLPYQALEKKTLLTELLDSLRKSDTVKEWWRSWWDLFVLGLNWMSNSFGRAPMQGVIFTLAMGFLFFYLNITQTEKYEMAMSLSWDVFVEEIPNFLKFILPTHGLDYLGPEFYKKYPVSNWYYVWDILGRIFVGFGIYQTIQAFRKFR